MLAVASLAVIHIMTRAETGCIDQIHSTKGAYACVVLARCPRTPHTCTVCVCMHQSGFHNFVPWCKNHSQHHISDSLVQIQTSFTSFTLIKYITTLLYIIYLNCLCPTAAGGGGAFSCTCPVWESPADGRTCWSPPSRTPPHTPALSRPLSVSAHQQCAEQRGLQLGRQHSLCAPLSCPASPASHSQHHQQQDTPRG